MPDIPPEAVRIALETYVREAYCDGEPIDGDERVIRRVLEAAAPAMAEHVAQAIIRHGDAHGPQPGKLGHHAYRRHFQTAAQVASLAFSTEDDIRRMAAAAIARGDAVACPGPESGNGGS